MEELAVGARAHLIDHGGLQVNHHAARHVLARTRLAEEGVEGVVAAADGLVARHLTIRLDAVLEAEELPARVSDLDASLANVDALVRLGNYQDVLFMASSSDIIQRFAYGFRPWCFNGFRCCRKLLLWFPSLIVLWLLLSR